MTRPQSITHHTLRALGSKLDLETRGVSGTVEIVLRVLFAGSDEFDWFADRL